MIVAKNSLKGDEFEGKLGAVQEKAQAQTEQQPQPHMQAQTQRRAVIDIGTNSVKLLVADVADSSVSPVLEQSHQTRLGQGFFETRLLQPKPIEDTAAAVAEFAQMARQNQASEIRVIATSAAREALNPAALLDAVRSTSGLTVEIIPGLTEAELAFRGISTDPALRGCGLVLMEVGGGSTQFIVGSEGTVRFLESFPIGSVRLLNEFKHGDPPTPDDLRKCRRWLKAFFAAQVQPKLWPALEKERERAHGGNATQSRLQLVGSGGTTSILGCMEAKLDHFDRAVLETISLPLNRVEWHVQNLWSLPLAERQKIVGLPQNRADIILNGAAIFEAAMREFGLGPLRISTRGVRFGAVLGKV